MINPQSTSIIYTFVHCQTPISCKETFLLMGKGKTKDPFRQMEKTYLKISWHHPVILDGRSKAKFSCYWSNQQNSQHKTFRATLSKHTHHFRGGHSVDEAGPPPPFQLSSPSLAFEGRDCLDLGHVHYFGPRHRRQSAAVAADAFLLQTYREVVLVMGIRRAFS